VVPDLKLEQARHEQVRLVGRQAVALLHQSGFPCASFVCEKQSYVIQGASRIIILMFMRIRHVALLLGLGEKLIQGPLYWDAGAVLGEAHDPSVLPVWLFL
jgi:hypothetical protein